MNHIILPLVAISIIIAGSAYGSLLMDRPSPYAPDYQPDCDLIVPAMRHTTAAAVVSEPEPLAAAGHLQYLGSYVPSIKRSTYMPGGQVCITYDDINRAVSEAQTLVGYPPQEVHELSSDFPKPPHIAVVSEILQTASQLLAKWYGLSKTAVLFGLPRVDTYKTAIRDICPTFLKPVKCELSKYRTLTGMCNNLDYPSWGSARSAMLRYLPPDYADGIKEPRKAKDGSPLPPARLVSFILHQDISAHDRHLTYLALTWGQMIDHDLTLAPSPTDDKSESIKCCEHPPHNQNHQCYPIQIPANDPFYKYFDRQCMDFLRSLPGVKPNCPLGPRAQQNSISSYIDANFIYGSTQEVATRLREFTGGRLKSSPIYHELGMKDLLPMKVKDPELGCERTGRPRNLYCFDGGDERLNEQLQLTVMHTVWLREHNRLAGELSLLNGHWDDEQLYQETRRLMGAVIQHITFNEFLPLIIGRKAMANYGLDLMPKGYYRGYDPKVNPGVRTAFQAAAFRFGHSILPDVTERYNKYHEKVESIRLSALLRQPYELYKPGSVDSFMLGLINQQTYRMDSEITTEVTNHLFEKPGEKFGLDLASMNVQRGREMGVPGYNEFRDYCGLPKLNGWPDLRGYFSNKTIQRYVSLYKSVDDIDLWSAGISEYPLPGALVGPTFACIIGEQFGHVRRGDRFWYENGGGGGGDDGHQNNSWPSQFTPEQLAELRKAKLARLLCDSSDDIHTIQLYPMLKANSQANPRVECSILPQMDLSPWKDTTTTTSNYINNDYKSA